MVKDNPAFLYGTCSCLTSLLCSLISCDYNTDWTGVLLKIINIFKSAVNLTGILLVSVLETRMELKECIRPTISGVLNKGEKDSA